MYLELGSTAVSIATVTSVPGTTDDPNVERRTRSLDILLTTDADRHRLLTSVGHRSSRFAVDNTATVDDTTDHRSRMNWRSLTKHRVWTVKMTTTQKSELPVRL